MAIGLPDGEGHVDIFVYDQANDIYNHADGIQGAQGDQNSIFEGEQSDATGRVLALSDDGSSVVVSSYDRNNGEGAVGVYSLERDETSPQLLRAVLSKDHKSVILEFDESLEHSYTEKDQFTVDADSTSGVAIDSVRIIGPFDSRVEISLVNSITDPDSVKVSYLDPSQANDEVALQDYAGNDVSSFANEPANLTMPPQLTSAEVLRDGRHTSQFR